MSGRLDRRSVITRFAPSPNGPLHLGHVKAACFAADLAARLGGRFLLRIEDIDRDRSREVFVDGIFEDLAWLGLRWEEPVLRQSEHFPAYIAAADQLRTLGLLYRCFATRAEIAAVADPSRTDPDGALIYPALHKNMPGDETAYRLAHGQPFAWRIDMAKAMDKAYELLGGELLSCRRLMADGAIAQMAVSPELWGDAIVVRKDVPASYHLAVVVDDARQGVTHVTRGSDLVAATSLHRLLQVLLGLPEPIYCHHELVLDAEGRKLSKSKGAESLATLRAQGVSAQGARLRADHMILL